MPHKRDEMALDEATNYVVASLTRPARRLVLAIAQTTNPKKAAKLQAKLDALRSSRTAR